MGTFLQEIFLRFSEAIKAWYDEEETTKPSCSGTPEQVVEYVVDETYSRLRFLSGYSRHLREPVATTLRHIDGLVEEIPGAIPCSRAGFSEDPRVNAFFADLNHLQEVFSRSPEVRELLDAELEAEECWALLCMKKEEHRRLGMSLIGDAVRKEVMQTTVNFVDHQILSPATSEPGARSSLKCCIFNGLLAYIRKQARDERIRVVELENRRDFLLARLHRSISENGSESRQELKREIDEIGKTLAREIPRLASLESRLERVIDVLGNPAQYVSSHLISIHLSRLGIKLDGNGTGTGNEILLFEIRVAAQGTRIGSLVRFPRTELLPRQDLVRKDDFFLTL